MHENLSQFFMLPSKCIEHVVTLIMCCILLACAEQAKTYLHGTLAMPLVTQVRICYDDNFQAIDCQQAKEVEDCQGDSISLLQWQETATAQHLTSS